MEEAIAGFIAYLYGIYLQWSPPVNEMASYLYNTLFFPILFFSSMFYLMAFTGIFSNPRPFPNTKIIKWPKISIQIPTKNEIVALRCAKKCLNFNYPKDKYEIIIGDDSTNTAISKAIDKFARKHPNQVKVTRRETREGFKAGNLNNMLKFSSGDIIVTFDSDFTPTRNFLKKVIPPFVKDQKVACVQTKWKHVNMEQNIVTRFASSVLMVYQDLLAHINGYLNVPLLFGSGQALRKDLLVKTGGWKEGSLTEDVEFSLRALKSGYKTMYLSGFKTAGEVPFTLRGYSKQQKRWAYGNAKNFMDYWRWILFGKNLNFFQRISITLTLIGYIASPFLVMFMFFGGLYFMTGSPMPLDIFRFFNTTLWNLVINSGFVAALMVALFREHKVRMFFHVLVGAFTVGLYTSFGVTSGFVRAISGKGMDWYMIRKPGNESTNPLFKASAS